MSAFVKEKMQVAFEAARSLGPTTVRKPEEELLQMLESSSISKAEAREASFHKFADALVASAMCCPVRQPRRRGLCWEVEAPTQTAEELHSLALLNKL